MTQGDQLQGSGANRYAAGATVLQARRHPGIRAAPAGREVRVVRIELLFGRGEFYRSQHWSRIQRELRAAVRAVVWPSGARTFKIYPKRHGNGVKPIKEAFVTKAQARLRLGEREKAWLPDSENTRKDRCCKGGWRRTLRCRVGNRQYLLVPPSPEQARARDSAQGVARRSSSCTNEGLVRLPHRPGGQLRRIGALL